MKSSSCHVEDIRKTCSSAVRQGLAWFERKLRTWTQPALPSLVLDIVGDLRRYKSELVWENALLRQQLIVMKRSVKQPKMTAMDQRILVVLASRLRAWPGPVYSNGLQIKATASSKLRDK